MKENQTPGFASATSMLRQSYAAAKQSMRIKLDATITISSLVLVAIDDKNLEKILNLPASLKEETFLSNVFSPKEMPKLSFLGCIILSGIEASQKPGDKKPSSEGIYIAKSEVFNIFSMSKRFDQEFVEIEKATNGFIKISRFQHLDQKTGLFLFNALCDPAKDFSRNIVTA